jgi:hypothetical protein
LSQPSALIHVFVGPTLSEKDVLARLDAVVSGPAAFGDVYRAAHRRPIAIAIIDGYFERIPAIWHKEILWAMSEGVHVFGASSMGALRAAELCDFGMVGVGPIFEAFRDGRLEDDDEVAVAHGQADTAFRPISEAMVNIRATLELAASQDVISAETSLELIALAKRTFYAERNYATLLEAGHGQSMNGTELRALRSWLPRGRVDQKRLDAEQLLDHVRHWQAQNPAPKRVSYSFEPTDAWHEARRIAIQSLTQTAQPLAEGDQALLDELKLAGVFTTAHARAAVRGWSLEAARRAGVRADALAVRTAVETFRRDYGLTDRQAFERWREEQRLDSAGLTRFFEDQARAAWAEPLSESLGHAQLRAELQASGTYGRLVERAERKARSLAQVGLAAPSLHDAQLEESDLWRWYFSELGLVPPPDLDAFARSRGFSDTEQLRRAVLREYCYRQREAAVTTAGTESSSQPAQKH